MAVAQTQAAKIMQERSSELTSHQVISLLMGGALERVTQAKKAVADGNREDKDILFAKVVAIINGLRASLNMDDGGDIAENLDALYEYIVNRLDVDSEENEIAALNEVGRLMLKLKSGWDAMDLTGVEQWRAAG